MGVSCAMQEQFSTAKCRCAVERKGRDQFQSKLTDVIYRVRLLVLLIPKSDVSKTIYQGRKYAELDTCIPTGAEVQISYQGEYIPARDA